MQEIFTEITLLSCAQNALLLNTLNFINFKRIELLVAFSIHFETHTHNIYLHVIVYQA